MNEAPSAPAPVDLADPDVEPSDEALEGLWARACADARATHTASLVRLHAEIGAERRAVLATLVTPRRSG